MFQHLGKMADIDAVTNFEMPMAVEFAAHTKTGS